MSVDSERVIELSRTKLVLAIAGSLLMMAAGAWLLMGSSDGSLLRTLGRFAPPWVFHALGAVAVVFFGGCAVYAGVKSLDHTPGLVLGPEGPVDNSSAVAAGFIPWSEVTGVHVFELNRQKMLVLHVADPEKYVGRGNALTRALNRANTSMCGSPIVISATALRIAFPELHREVASRLPARPLGSEDRPGFPSIPPPADAARPRMRTRSRGSARDRRLRWDGGCRG